MQVIQDFGPMSPSDGYGSFCDEHYWLAEVEWLETLDVDPLPAVNASDGLKLAFSGQVT